MAEKIEANPDHRVSAAAVPLEGFLKGWHVFRHSFISALASKGVDQRIIDDIVGHQTEQQRRRYRHLYPDVKQGADAGRLCGPGTGVRRRSVCALATTSEKQAPGDSKKLCGPRSFDSRLQPCRVYAKIVAMADDPLTAKRNPCDG